MNKNIARLRRAKSTRSHIRTLGVARLSVLRTGQHLYAQVFTADGSKVLAAANTAQAEVMEGLKNGKNCDAAAKVGKMIAERAKAGYRYHGRIKALADAAREGGLQF
jgi:large subunit ribosomal protein L18